jgi:hypothetical protein
MDDVVAALMVRGDPNLKEVRLVSACTAIHGSSGMVTSLVGVTIVENYFMVRIIQECAVPISDDEFRTRRWDSDGRQTGMIFDPLARPMRLKKNRANKI